MWEFWEEEVGISSKGTWVKSSLIESDEGMLEGSGWEIYFLHGEIADLEEDLDFMVDFGGGFEVEEFSTWNLDGGWAGSFELEREDLDRRWATLFPHHTFLTIKYSLEITMLRSSRGKKWEEMVFLLAPNIVLRYDSFLCCLFLDWGTLRGADEGIGSSRYSWSGMWILTPLTFLV